MESRVFYAVWAEMLQIRKVYSESEVAVAEAGDSSGTQKNGIISRW
jgi:hypothetical protein